MLWNEEKNILSGINNFWKPRRNIPKFPSFHGNNFPTYKTFKIFIEHVSEKGSECN